LTELTIHSLIERNTTFASILNRYGVKFYEVKHLTLSEVCFLNNISKEKLLKEFEAIFDKKTISIVDLEPFPINLTIEYLQQTHHSYIKFKLPYLVQTISDLAKGACKNYKQVKEMKILFPEFVANFEKHIKLEEDILFPYIKQLPLIASGELDLYKSKLLLDHHSIANMAEKHENDDDELFEFDVITDNYKINKNHNVEYRVIIEELKQFKKDLAIHAEIEEKLLLPKAIELEKKAKRYFMAKIREN
jgi:regulator of cell morphogenesis and NO signaling